MVQEAIGREASKNPSCVAGGDGQPHVTEMEEPEEGRPLENLHQALDDHHERDSRTGLASVTSPQLAGMRIDGSATVRSVARPGLPDQRTRLAKLNLTGHWDSIGSDWNLGYQVDNSRTEVLGRQIIYVGERQGDYDQSGRFVGRGQG